MSADAELPALREGMQITNYPSLLEIAFSNLVADQFEDYTGEELHPRNLTRGFGKSCSKNSRGTAMDR